MSVLHWLCNCMLIICYISYILLYVEVFDILELTPRIISIQSETVQFVILYRVNHIALWFLIWLKMTLKCIVHMKTRRFYNHNNPPFDMKHQLMSADSLPVVKIDLKLSSWFSSIFLLSLPWRYDFVETNINMFKLDINFRVLNNMFLNKVWR